MAEFDKIKRQLLEDMAVVAESEFDRNFERKAFFDRPWAPRRRSDIGSLMARTGALRRSLTYDIRASSIVVSSSMSYAEIHNEGGSISITPRMRRYWFRKYYESGKKDRAALAMAITKKQEIQIPKRQYVGDHPQLRQQMQRAAELRLKAWAKSYMTKRIGKK